MQLRHKVGSIRFRQRHERSSHNDEFDLSSFRIPSQSAPSSSSGDDAGKEKPHLVNAVSQCPELLHSSFGLLIRIIPSSNSSHRSRLVTLAEKHNTKSARQLLGREPRGGNDTTHSVGLGRVLEIGIRTSRTVPKPGNQDGGSSQEKSNEGAKRVDSHTNVARHGDVGAPMGLGHDRHDCNLIHEPIIPESAPMSPSPGGKKKKKKLTPLAVRTGLALSLGSRMSLTSCGTAAIISTSLGMTEEPTFFATAVLSALRLTDVPSWWETRRARTISVQQRMVSSD